MIRAAIAAALLAACCAAHAATIEVEPLPEVPLDREDATRALTKREVLAMLRAATPAAAEFKLEDDRYFLVSRAWFEQMFRWVKSFLARQLGPERVEGFLIERPREVALLIESLAELDVQRSHQSRGQALVGMLAVECHRAWAQVPLDGHICFFVVFGTRDGLFVLEPSTDRIDALGDFPLRNDILRLYF